MSHYPSDLVQKLQFLFAGRTVRIPDPSILFRLLDTAYHASFLTEEGRSPSFQLAYVDPNDSKLREKGRRTVEFRTARDFKPAELNRLAPACEKETTIIGVKGVVGELKIWGTIHIGSYWERYRMYETDGSPTPPHMLKLSSNSPGEIICSSGGTVYLILRNGEIKTPSKDVIRGGEIGNSLLESAKKLRQECAKKLGVSLEELKAFGIELEYQRFLERIIFKILSLGHGGALIIVPSNISADDSKLNSCIKFKYAGDHKHAWNAFLNQTENKFHRHQIIIAQDAEKYKDYRKFDSRSNAWRSQLVDIADEIATFSSVDGAVVVNSMFDVLGYGGEITIGNDDFQNVRLADSQEVISIQEYGTRHRSAFRFVSEFDDAIVFIISQDGGVKCTKRVGDEVVLWPEINSGQFGV